MASQDLGASRACRGLLDSACSKVHGKGLRELPKTICGLLRLQESHGNGHSESKMFRKFTITPNPCLLALCHLEKKPYRAMFEIVNFKLRI